MGVGGPGIGAATSVLTKLIPFYVRFSKDTWTEAGNAVAEIFNADDAAVRTLRNGGTAHQASESLPSDARRTQYARVFNRARDERVVAGAKGKALLGFVEVGMDVIWQQLLLSAFDGSPEDLERMQRVALEREHAQERMAALGGLAAFDQHLRATREFAAEPYVDDADPKTWATHWSARNPLHQIGYSSSSSTCQYAANSFVTWTSASATPGEVRTDRGQPSEPMVQRVKP